MRECVSETESRELNALFQSSTVESQQFILKIEKQKKELKEVSPGWQKPKANKSKGFYSSHVVAQSLSHVQHLWPRELKRGSALCPSPSPGVCPSSRLLNQWCRPTISSSATLFSFCLQSFPASESFPMSQLFTSGGQSIGASALATVLPMNIQGWFPLRWTDYIHCMPFGNFDYENDKVWKWMVKWTAYVSTHETGMVFID